MKTPIPYDPDLFEFYVHVLLEVCRICKVWPYEVLDHHRTRPASTARHLVIYILRRCVSRPNRKSRWTISQTRPQGYTPLSTTSIGSLLRVDHSAILHGTKLVTDDEADAVADRVWQSWEEARARRQQANEGSDPIQGTGG